MDKISTLFSTPDFKDQFDKKRNVIITRNLEPLSLNSDFVGWTTLSLPEDIGTVSIVDLYQSLKNSGFERFDNVVVIGHLNDSLWNQHLFDSIAHFLVNDGSLVVCYSDARIEFASKAKTQPEQVADLYRAFENTFTIAKIQKFLDWNVLVLFKANLSLHSNISALKQVIAQSQSRLAEAEKEIEYLKELNIKELERSKKYIGLLERQVRNNKETLSFQLGNILLTSTKSVNNFLSTPSKLFALRKFAKQKKQHQLDTAPQPSLIAKIGRKDVEVFAREYKQGGIERLVSAVKLSAESIEPDAMALYYLQIGKKLFEAGLPSAERELVDRAFELSMNEPVVRGAFWALMRAQDFDIIPEVVSKYERTLSDKPSEKEKNTLAKLRSSPAYQTALLKQIPSEPKETIESVPNSICYFLHNSLPYSSGGYATRAQGVAYGLSEAGYDVTLVTRPGFPLDVKPELSVDEVAIEETIDGLKYVRMLYPARKGMNTNDYILQAAREIELFLRKRRPAIVIAASNYYTGLPAMIAAKRLGITFVYELRGFWEITRLSREPEFETHPSYVIQRRMEAEMVNHANVSFTLTQPMREEMQSRGCRIEDIHLLPNSCRPEKFEPRGRDTDLAVRLGIPSHVPVIGYIGTFAAYEGLEDLATAAAILKSEGREFRLMLVGNENASGLDRGPITSEIQRVADENRFSDWLIMPGRVPHEEVESYYSLIDIAPFPRKPWPVCEMVSPMKPLEALAMKKAVLVSSVRALVEMIQADKTGLVFEKGSIESLATQLGRLLDSQELRVSLGNNGREWVEKERTWINVGRTFRHVLDGLPSFNLISGEGNARP